MIFMFVFACESTSPIEKALYYVPMQVLVDMKLNNDIAKNLIYSERAKFWDHFLGWKIEILKMIQKASRMVPESFRAT